MELDDYSESSYYNEGDDEITVCNMTFKLKPGEFVLHDYGPRVVLGLLVLVIFLVGILGNLFVVVAVILSKRLQTTTNVFVINLAVADFLTAMFLPVHASTLMSKSSCYIPDLLCKFVAASTLTTLGCSVVTLAMIAFHRFTILNAVMKPRPKFGNVFTIRNIVIMVSFTWLYPIILMFIILPLDIGSLGYALQYKVCTQKTENEHSDFLTLTVCLLVQFPAFVVIIVCYIYIFKMFSRHQRQMNAMMTPTVKVTTTDDDEVNITVVEDLPTEPSNDLHNGVVNPGFDEGDGIKTAPPEDKENLTEPSDASELRDEVPMENGKHSPTSQMAPNQDNFVKSPTGTIKPKFQVITRETLAKEQENVRFKQQRKITINLFIVVCVYTICVMPSAIAFLIPTSDPAVPWLTILFLCNVCVNPIIYALRHPTFGEVLKCMMECRYRDIPEPSSFLRTYAFTN